MKNIRYWRYLSSCRFDKSSPKSSSTPPRSQETLAQIDVNDKDTLVVDSEEGFTSHDLIATADENSFASGGGMAENRVTDVISPVSSIEVINNFSAANDAENMPLGSDSQNNLVSEVLVHLFSKFCCLALDMHLLTLTVTITVNDYHSGDKNNGRKGYNTVAIGYSKLWI